MLLGFDATTIRGNKTGVGYYSSRLLERITRVGGEDNPIDELLIYSNRPPAPVSVPRSRPVEEGYFPLRAVWMQGVLPLLLRKTRPDLCHFTNFLAPYFTETPYVVTFHDMTLQLLPQYHTWRKRLLTASLSPEIARRARLIITPSESAREDVARLFRISSNKIRAIPHAADTQFRPRRDPESLDLIERRYGLEKPYLLYVGTLEPRKNLGRVMTAFSRIADRFPDHRFFLAGDLGWQSRELFSSIDALGLSRRVVRLGYVDEEDLPALYSHADLFVYPSLYEGFGFPVVEAMACGVPVVTSTGSSLAEIADGAALVADPENVDQLSDALARGLSDEPERDRLRRVGLERARAFSWERAARETLSVYQEALERKLVRSRSDAPSETPPNEARAVVNTISYAALFDYPLTLDEIRRGLMGVSLTERKLKELLEHHPMIREQVECEPPFYFLKGRKGSVETRRRAGDRTRKLLEQHRGVLDRIRATPFVRMVALSGATAHGNARDEDIDLFVITAPGRTWAVALVLFVAMKLAGLRRTICLNYLVGEDRLALSERDPFTASQISSLRPLAGRASYYRFVRANAWGARFFPNFWERFRELEPVSDDEPETGSLLLESLLTIGGGFLLERLGRSLLGRHLRRKLRSAGAGSSVKLEAGLIKLHFHDHGSGLSREIESLQNSGAPEQTERLSGVSTEANHVSSL